MKPDNELIKEWIEDIEYRSWNESDQVITQCRLSLNNGFSLIGHSVCLDPVGYDSELGKFYSFEDALRYLRVINDFMEHEVLSKEPRSGE